MIIKGENSSLINKLILFGMLFSPFFLSAQEDSVRVFEEITIIRLHKGIEEHTTLRKDDITNIAPVDVGEILQYINGVTVKNYGGIGGMKTLSSRGLGGEHTQLVIDGLPINDAQSGQINFATIQPDNIEEISVSHQSEQSMSLLPVSALIKGSNVQISTFEQRRSTKPISVRSNFTLGSFGQKEAFVGAKIAKNANYLAISGGIGTYKGDYPYRLKFGQENQEFTRKNNALKDFHVTLGNGWMWKRSDFVHVLDISANTHQIDQQLAGAVILYNDLAKETLKTWNTRAGIKYKMHYGRFTLNSFANFTHRFLHYYDPNYLNIDGFIDNRYTTLSANAGVHLRYILNDFTFHFGNDFTYDNLASNRNLGNPIRNSNTTMLKAQYYWKYFNVQASVFAQVFVDNNRIQTHRNNYLKIHPQLAIFTSDELLKDWQFFAWYKPSSRAASFNELYFSQVGNKDLKPEESSQLDVGIRYVKRFKKFDLQVQANGFKNLVKNKILALPTKNMFIWSIQNIGKVDIYGADLNVIGNWEIDKDWGINFQIGANYQKAVDIADKNAPTYRHQIAYTPEFTGNATVSGRYKTIGLHIAGLYIGERYSLNENIPTNMLDAYFTMDISASYDFVIQKEHTLKLQIGVKNVMDKSYSFIRYFEMPGRSYFIKVGYEL